MGQDRLWALVLAGGDGRRLQPLTRQLTGAPIPKQYCPILGDRSLLEATLDRIAPLVPADRTLAIITRHHLPLARPQLRMLPRENVLVQPRNLDTGPGLLRSLRALARRDPDARVVVFPSDHHVRADERFHGAVRRMLAVADRHPGAIVLLGLEPEHADAGYGYLVPGRALDGDDAFRVAAFLEKPGRGVAADIVRRGGLWNAFVMTARVAPLLALVERTGAALTTPWNFSRDFLTRVAERLIVVRGERLGWSDWGTPDAIERSFAAMGLVPPWLEPERATA